MPWAACQEELQVGGEIVDGVIRAELHAADQAVAVIEGRENDRRAELPLVDQVLRLLVELSTPSVKVLSRSFCCTPRS